LFPKFPLAINERAQDPDFREFLMKVGNGELGVAIVNGEKTVATPEQYMSPFLTLANIPKFVNSIYDEDIPRNPDQPLVLANELSSAANLAPIKEAHQARLSPTTVTIAVAAPYTCPK
jgi:hypothetical protein